MLHSGGPNASKKCVLQFFRVSVFSDPSLEEKAEPRVFFFSSSSGTLKSAQYQYRRLARWEVFLLNVLVLKSPHSLSVIVFCVVSRH